MTQTRTRPIPRSARPALKNEPVSPRPLTDTDPLLHGAGDLGALVVALTIVLLGVAAAVALVVGLIAALFGWL